MRLAITRSWIRASMLAIACLHTVGASVIVSARVEFDAFREDTLPRHKIQLDPDTGRVFEQYGIITGRPGALLRRVDDFDTLGQQKFVHRVDILAAAAAEAD